MKINKILLVAPAAYTSIRDFDINPLPPMGLGYLSSVAEGLGFDVNILDCLVEGWECRRQIDEKTIRVGLGPKEIEDYIKSYDPDIIGVNCQFSRQYGIYSDLFAQIKSIKKDVILVAGGAHATVCAMDVLADINCDYVVLGEGELSFKDLLISLRDDEDVSTIDGLGWKDESGVYINPKSKYVEALDDLAFPAYHLMHLEKYFGLTASHGARHKKRFSPIITSRGCPARCSFCSVHRVWGNRYRYRSVDNVVEEMRLLKEVYAVEEIMFEDDNVTANPKRAKALFSRMIEEDFGFVWDTPNGAGVWTMDEEMISLMKRSGCIKLNFPVESGSQYVLREIIRKPLDLQKVKGLVGYCKSIGLEYGLFFVVGMPGEKVSDIWKSFFFSASCGCYNPHMSVATPYPGSALFDDCMQNGYLSDDFRLDDLYIRSFVIKTKEWDAAKLKSVLFFGRLYLLVVGILKNPRSFVSFYRRILSRVSRMSF